MTPEEMALSISRVTGVQEPEPVRALALQLIRRARVDALETLSRDIDQLDIDDTQETQWGFAEACRLIQERIRALLSGEEGPEGARP